MNDMTAVFESLAILERKYQDMAERVRILEQQRTEDRERLNAHGQLLTMREYREDLRKRMEEAGVSDALRQNQSFGSQN